MKLNPELMLNRRKIRRQKALRGEALRDHYIRMGLLEGVNDRLLRLKKEVDDFIEKVKYYRGWQNEK